jgi:hypothetical protein
MTVGTYMQPVPITPNVVILNLDQGQVYNLNSMNNFLSPQTIENKNDHDI